MATSDSITLLPQIQQSHCSRQAPTVLHINLPTLGSGRPSRRSPALPPTVCIGPDAARTITQISLITDSCWPAVCERTVDTPPPSCCESARRAGSFKLSSPHADFEHSSSENLKPWRIRVILVQMLPNTHHQQHHEVSSAFWRSFTAVHSIILQLTYHSSWLLHSG